MKLASVFAVFLLAFTFAVPVHAIGTENVALEVGPSDLFASVPLCTYWYTKADRQGITPQMTITNHGFSPITVTGTNLPGSMAVIAGIPCNIIPSMRQDFVLTENPSGQSVQKRADKQAVIFTISKIGG
ncbi:hypothetical protein SDC9_132598 [bioreactor metagenome]|uniref:Uncharacterized protein n=1 Tax=bioreactor metagenome TaxID=1076179 RepID=A0A645D8J3_9ZZZZ